MGNSKSKILWSMCMWYHVILKQASSFQRVLNMMQAYPWAPFMWQEGRWSQERARKQNPPMLESARKWCVNGSVSNSLWLCEMKDLFARLTLSIQQLCFLHLRLYSILYKCSCFGINACGWTGAKYLDVPKGGVGTSTHWPSALKRDVFLNWSTLWWVWRAMFSKALCFRRRWNNFSAFLEQLQGRAIAPCKIWQMRKILTLMRRRSPGSWCIKSRRKSF